MKCIDPTAMSRDARLAELGELLATGEIFRQLGQREEFAREDLP